MMPSRVEVHIRGGLISPDGRLIRRFPWVRANSLLKAFIQCLYVQASQASVIIKSTTGTDSSVNASANAFKMSAASGGTGYGIVIGTGTNPVTMLDNKLQTQVTTNIAHSAHNFAVENPNDSTWRLSVSRVFTNNTGAVLAVREVGLYWSHNGLNLQFCMDRTLYSVNVPNGVGLPITYRISVVL